MKSLKIDVVEFKKHITTFSLASLDTQIILVGDDLVRHCVQLSNRINSMPLAKYLAKTAIFVYLLKMHKVIESRTRGNAKLFHEELMLHQNPATR